MALSDRYGITVENGHVTKISLASNNLQGIINDYLMDCEFLREPILHRDNIEEREWNVEEVGTAEWLHLYTVAREMK